MIYRKPWENLPLHAQLLIKPNNQLRKSVQEGSTQINGGNQKEINEIWSSSEMVGTDFLSCKKDYDAGKVPLKEYVAVLNVIGALINKKVEFAPSFPMELFQSEYARVRRILDDQRVKEQKGATIQKAYIPAPVYNPASTKTGSYFAKSTPTKLPSPTQFPKDMVEKVLGIFDECFNKTLAQLKK